MQESKSWYSYVDDRLQWETFVKRYNMELYSQMPLITFFFFLKRRPRGGVCFSGVGGIWDGPLHSENMHCGQINQYFRSLLGQMDAVCSRPKTLGFYQCSFTLLWWQHWCRRVHWDFRATYAAFRITSFPGTSMHSSARQYRSLILHTHNASYPRCQNVLSVVRRICCSPERQKKNAY